jgi:geranyl diphosphate 2-C-methyltransferase
MINGVLHTQNQQELSQAVFDYYNNKKKDRNLLQSEVDGLVHHHFGISGTTGNTTTQEEILHEIQRQETAQTNLLIDKLRLDGFLNAHVYDVGCGRGGTSFRMLERHPSISVTGINLTEYQTEFCKGRAKELLLNDKFNVLQGDFMNAPFENNKFTHVVVNEVTPYAHNLSSFMHEINRVLVNNGGLVLATWCYNNEKDTSEFWKFLNPICVHYASSMHGVKDYRKSISENFTIKEELDLTKEVIEYWELRKKWIMQSGVEQFFLDAHNNDDMRYVVFVGEKL